MSARPLRIVHLTTVHSALDIRIFHKEARTLADAGYDVTVLGPHDADCTLDGVKVSALPFYQRRLPRMTLGAWRGLRRCLALRADAYHFHDPELLPAMWLLRLLRRVPVIYDMHENLPKAILTKPWVSDRARGFASGLFRALERWWAAGMPVVFAEDSYRADYPWVRTSATVLNMPRTAELAAIARPKRARPTVAYFGAVNAQRGSLTTLRALAQLREHGIDPAFECIGVISDAHATELRALAEELGVTITVHGRVLPQYGWDIVAQCHVGVALLHPLPNYVESYPTKLFEYMALGLPVVASDFPLYRGVVDDAGCGLCVDPLDVGAIAGALAELLADPAAAHALGARGREVALRRYSWENEAGKLLALYETVLNRHGVSR